MKVKKKVGFVIGIIAISLVALFFLTIVINSVVATNNRKSINDAYGDYYETTSGKINYTIIGEGDTTVVMLPGQGSVSPHYEFLDIANRMSVDYKIIIVEPLGYGLSDDTDVTRSSENICNEIHQVLTYLDEDEYYLMGHSIAGLYELLYANMFESEVLGIIGLDASVPSQINDDNVSSRKTMLNMYRLFFVNTGLLRLAMIGIEDAPDETFDNPAIQGTILQCFRNLSSEERKVFAELYVSRAQNRTMINEVSMFDSNANSEMELSFPASIPVLYILASDSVTDNNNWQEYHENLTDNNPLSQTVVIEGNHYVHLSASEDVLRITSDFVN